MRTERLHSVLTERVVRHRHTRKGAGKSTFASILSDLGLTVISQDELGSRVICERRIVEALLAGKDVVVDRLNFDVPQRKHWVDYSQAAGAALGVIVFATPLQECMRRVQTRTGHKTLKPGEESNDVVRMISNKFVFPKRDEGFGFCRVVREDRDAQRVYGELSAWFGQKRG